MTDQVYRIARLLATVRRVKRLAMQTGLNNFQQQHSTHTISQRLIAKKYAPKHKDLNCAIFQYPERLLINH
jgi:hypothetical protein